MKLKETFDRIGLIADDKARRRLNVSGKTANLSADEIEHGLSLEALEACGVPVFRYQTQVTVHGIIPGFDESAKIGGYQSIFRNGNGTLGVRYVAIDAEKKAALEEALTLCKSAWKPNVNSSGFSIHLFSMEKEPVIEAMRTFPRDLVCGCIYAGAGVFGGYYAIAEIGAIPAENLDRLIDMLTGTNAAGRVILREEKTRQDEADKAQQTINLARWEKEREAKRAAGLDKARQLALTLGEPLRVLPKIGRFRRVYLDRLTGEPGVRTFTLAKRGPRVCYSRSGQKWKVFEDTLRAKWEREAQAGFIFPFAG